MGRGALRGAMTAWLGLIALQAVSTTGGSGRISALFGDVNRLVERALDPKVPAIPDRRTAAPAASAPAAPMNRTYGSADAADRYNIN
jgi:hypothetical protein